MERWSTASRPGGANARPLFPFLDLDRVSTGVITDLTTMIGSHSPFTVRFAECRRFPTVLYLAPTPDKPFRDLTDSIVRRWPEAPPYEGRFTEVVPHLTVAHDQEPEVFDEVEIALTAQLPTTATISTVTLFVSDGHRWQPGAQFPMLG